MHLTFNAVQNDRIVAYFDREIFTKEEIESIFGDLFDIKDGQMPIESQYLDDIMIYDENGKPAMPTLGGTCLLSEFLNNTTI